MSTEEEWTPRVRRVSGGPSERLQFATSLIREERFDEAREELLSILVEDDNSTQARTVLGSLYLRQQQHADALEQFRLAMKIDPLMVQPHVMAGSCCMRMGDIEEARTLFQTALDLNPKQVNAHVGIAQVLAQTGQPEQAISHLEEALRLDPQMTSARMLRARLLSDAGKIDEAIGELTTLVNTNPDHTAAALQLAKMYRQKGNTAGAIELLEGALKANPEAGQVWELLGRVKMSMQDYAGAEKAFVEAMGLKSEDRAVPLRLVDVLVKQGKLDQAREVLQTVPRRGRMASAVHRYYGDIYAAQKLFNEAVESYRAFLLNVPNGEKIVAEADAAAGPGADNAAKVPHFQAAIAALREELRETGRQPGRAAGVGGQRGSGPARRAPGATNRFGRA